MIGALKETANVVQVSQERRIDRHGLAAKPTGPEALRIELAAVVEQAVFRLLRILSGADQSCIEDGAFEASLGKPSGAFLARELLHAEGRDMSGACNELLLRRLATLDSVHQLLVTGAQATSRELFYAHAALFKCQRRSDDSLKWLCRVLRVPRHVLQVNGSAKGLVRGHLRIFEPTGFGSSSGCWVDGMDSLEPRGHVISPICAHVVRVESSARIVLVVEKETVFHRLIEEGVLERHRPLIVVTGRGFPDLPTRYLLRRICEDCAQPRVLALVDYDPDGMNIAANYAFGTEGQTSWFQEDLGLANTIPLICPDGAAGATARFGLAASDVTPLTRRDQSLARGLQGRLARYRISGRSIPSVWDEALKSMLAGGVKYELDSLDKLADLVAVGIRRLLDQFDPEPSFMHGAMGA
eukprot:TRINITY_DN31734_c0_g1_i1.p1 TRINITY_DN31734_c0_g1~~TRINITY_DN31734_c0_g1_i1.p1  ORF type:complete len:469 (-),score=72.19 TRINITY_DN31734_c0_g1_i1:244-1479(-)